MVVAAYLSGCRKFDFAQTQQFSRSESRLDHFAAVCNKSREELCENDIEDNRLQVQERLARSDRRGVIKTHNARLTREGRRLIFSRYTRAAIYVVRNPLDIVDSMADHTNRSIAATIALMNNSEHRLGATATLARQYVGTWSHHVVSWTRNRDEFPVFVVKYEDLHSLPVQTFGTLVEWLGWPLDAAQLQRAIRLTSFSRLQRAEAETGFSETSPVARSGRFFRRGKPGSWREVLSRQQAEQLIEHHATAMQMVGYELPNSNGI
jgi:hypothetical protein